MSKKKVTQKKAAVKKEIAPKKAAASKTQSKITGDTVQGFRPESQAARMYNLLVDGKARSVQEIHKAIPETTESHVGNGLLYVLLKRGTETSQFHIVMTKDHQLQLVMGRKPEKVARTPKASPKTSRTATTAGKAVRQ